MFSSGTLSMIIALIAISCYFIRIYFPFPPVTVIGIDLGTSFSAAAYFNNGFGNVSLIFDEHAHSTFPSFVTIFKNGSYVVGKSRDPSWPAHVTFYDSKRYIGRENLTLNDILTYPFKINLINGEVFFVIPNNFKHNFKSNLLSAGDIAALILTHVKNNFRAKFGYNPKMAVIGVPVEFDDRQRAATVAAAAKAGLAVLRLVNEPTAASMACDVHNRPAVKHVAVIDLGGGTFDVAVLSSLQRTLSTLSIAGNDKLGGRDFTQKFATCILKKTDNIFNFKNFEYENFLQKIEAAKIFLSNFDSYNFSFLKNEINFTITTTRDEFDECTDEIFQKIIKPIEVALEEAELTTDDIQEIVLVGGATRMPKLRKIIADFFKREPNKSVDPDTAVVVGLANQAGILTQGWPLEQSAIDIPPKSIKKICVT